MSKERVKSLDMNMGEVVMLMCGGNPGAATVCMKILNDSPAIDPDAAGMGLLSLLALDSLGIHDSRIWMFYKDCCGSDLAKMLAVMRAYQLGQLAGVTESAINHAIDNYGVGIDLDAAMKAVQERLPRFNAK